MPVPIRPVREIEENIPSVLRDGGFSAMGLSELQIKMLGLAEHEKESAKKIVVDSRDAEMIHEIWTKQEEDKLVTAEDIKKIKMFIPDSVSDRDVIRMKTNGLIIGADREVSLTAKGEKVLKDKILSQPSVHFLNRTKEKFDFEKTAGAKMSLKVLYQVKQAQILNSDHQQLFEVLRKRMGRLYDMMIRKDQQSEEAQRLHGIYQSLININNPEKLKRVLPAIENILREYERSL